MTTCYIVKPSPACHRSPPDRCGRRWSPHGFPFRFVWSALAWPCMAAVQLVSGGQVSACGYREGSPGVAHPVARPGRQGPTSQEACAFMTHPRKGMTLDACSLGDFHEKEAGSCPQLTRVWREPQRRFRQLISVHSNGGGQGKRRESKCLTLSTWPAVHSPRFMLRHSCLDPFLVRAKWKEVVDAMPNMSNMAYALAMRWMQNTPCRIDFSS